LSDREVIDVDCSVDSGVDDREPEVTAARHTYNRGEQ